MSVARLASLKGKLAVAQSNVKFYSEVIERFEKEQSLKAAKRERAQQAGRAGDMNDNPST